jgi:hypothetical protein
MRNIPASPSVLRNTARGRFSALSAKRQIDEKRTAPTFDRRRVLDSGNVVVTS